MRSNSFLDALLSMFNGASPGVLMMIPYLFFHLLEIWFAAVGWNRHRAPGFLFFLAAGASGMIASLIWLTASAASSDAWRGSSLFSFASALGFIGSLLTVTGLGLLAYRAVDKAPAAVP